MKQTYAEALKEWWEIYGEWAKKAAQKAEQPRKASQVEKLEQLYNKALEGKEIEGKEVDNLYELVLKCSKLICCYGMTRDTPVPVYFYRDNLSSNDSYTSEMVGIDLEGGETVKEDLSEVMKENAVPLKIFLACQLSDLYHWWYKNSIMIWRLVSKKEVLSQDHPLYKILFEQSDTLAILQSLPNAHAPGGFYNHRWVDQEKALKVLKIKQAIGNDLLEMYNKAGIFPISVFEQYAIEQSMKTDIGDVWLDQEGEVKSQGLSLLVILRDFIEREKTYLEIETGVFQDMRKSKCHKAEERSMFLFKGYIAQFEIARKAKEKIMNVLEEDGRRLEDVDLERKYDKIIDEKLRELQQKLVEDGITEIALPVEEDKEKLARIKETERAVEEALAKQRLEYEAKLQEVSAKLALLTSAAMAIESKQADSGSITTSSSENTVNSEKETTVQNSPTSPMSSPAKISARNSNSKLKNLEKETLENKSDDKGVEGSATAAVVPTEPQLASIAIFPDYQPKSVPQPANLEDEFIDLSVAKAEELVVAEARINTDE
jgi:hypothetical protein